ncbi:MAG TPA: oxidoreductase, partial [Planctomycetaceae bacterium]|nr:oxidoreductase [Planctomycetaceae bacterium]
MRGQNKMKRRDFVKATSAGALLSGGVWSEVAAAESTASSGKLNVACVGTANRAAADISGVRQENIVALVDIDKSYLDRAA